MKTLREDWKSISSHKKGLRKRIVAPPWQNDTDKPLRCIPDFSQQASLGCLRPTFKKKLKIENILQDQVETGIAHLRAWLKCKKASVLLSVFIHSLANPFNSATCKEGHDSKCYEFRRSNYLFLHSGHPLYNHTVCL